MINIGKVLSKRPVIQSEVQAMKEKRKLKFGGAEFELRAQNAYIGAAVGLVFGLRYESAFQPPPHENLDRLFSSRHRHGAPPSKAHAAPTVAGRSFEGVVPWWGARYGGEG